MTQTLAQAYLCSADMRQELVAPLQQQGILHSQRIKDALLETPREAFVSTFFLDGDLYSSSTPWQEISPSHPDYLHLVYQNLSLVTHLNELSIPDSSSSMPTVMVQMLEALEVHSYHSVLEIGTGTGWNAGLLAYLAASCTSVDIEPSYVDHLVRLAHDFHLNTIHTAVADGIYGYPHHAPYDRIIATASTPIVPMAWIDQLNANGRIICDLTGPLARAFLIIEKDAQGQVTGHFLPQPLYFMPMKSDMLPDSSVRLSKLPSLDENISHLLSTSNESLTMLLESLQHDRSFRWFLQWNMLHIKLQRLLPQNKERMYLIAPDDRCYLVFSRKQDNHARWQGALHAEDHQAISIWERLGDIYRQWERLGKPPVEHYTVRMEQTIPVLCIADLVLPTISHPKRVSPLRTDAR